jgi:hypothetical protein
MAVALKTQQFMSSSELTKFVAAGGNNVTTIVSIVYDTGSGKYVVFYT